MMFAVRERQVFIINVCLSCLPAVYTCIIVNSWERLLLSRIGCLTFPGVSLPRKILLTVLCQIRRDTKGEKRTTVQGAALGCHQFLQRVRDEIWNAL